jgi:hypothetical protein
MFNFWTGMTGFGTVYGFHKAGYIV